MENNDNTSRIIENDTLDFSTPIKKKKTYKFFDALNSYLKDINRVSCGKIEIVNFKSSIVKFSKLFLKKNSRVRYLYVILIALLMSFITLFLIQNSGLYSSGFGGILQGVARVVRSGLKVNGASPELYDAVYNALFWGLYLICNIPLIIFSWYKISKEFSILTLVYIFFNQMFGLAFSFIPGIHDIHIFGDIPQIASAISFSSWNDPNSYKLLVYAITNGIFISLPFSILFIIGSSTGGSDIVSFYFVKQKNKSIGNILVLVNTLSILVATLIGTVAALGVENYNYATINNTSNFGSGVIQTLLSPNLIFSALVTIISSFMINLLFPKNKFTQIKIYTKNAELLRDKLIMSGYKHDVYINEIKNGIDNINEFTLETICMYIELPELLNNIRAIDHSSLITINALSDIDGEMYAIK